MSPLLVIVIVVIAATTIMGIVGMVFMVTLEAIDMWRDEYRKEKNRARRD